MADALASGASVLRDVGVQVPLRPPIVGRPQTGFGLRPFCSPGSELFPVPGLCPLSRRSRHAFDGPLLVRDRRIGRRCPDRTRHLRLSVSDTEGGSAAFRDGIRCTGGESRAKVPRRSVIFAASGHPARALREPRDLVAGQNKMITARYLRRVFG